LTANDIVLVPIRSAPVDLESILTAAVSNFIAFIQALTSHARSFRSSRNAPGTAASLV
jgi:hypothetical protein